MQISLFNSKNPNGKRVPITVVVEQSDIISTRDGELIYLITLNTGAIGINGKQVDTVFINGVSNKYLIEELNKGLAVIGSKIDWGILESDNAAPIIIDIFPKDKEDNISINSEINLTIKDPFPTSLIDLSTIKLKVNGIDVTNTLFIKQKGLDVVLNWIPIKIL